MADPTPTPTPTPAPKAKRQRGTINREHLDELKNSRAVATAALDPANAATLAAVDFDATLPAQINTLAGSTETAIGKLTGTRAAKTEMTAQEKTGTTPSLPSSRPSRPPPSPSATGWWLSRPPPCRWIFYPASSPHRSPR
jgi:hypothetical protein